MIRLTRTMVVLAAALASLVLLISNRARCEAAPAIAQGSVPQSGSAQDRLTAVADRTDTAIRAEVARLLGRVSLLNGLGGRFAQFADNAATAHKALEEALGLQIHGMLVGTYEFNSTHPTTGNNLFRVYDYYGASNFEFAQGELYFERKVPGQLGFVFDLNTGTIAQRQYRIVTTYWKVPGVEGGCPQSPCGWLDPTRAYLDYTIPVGNGIQLYAGSQYSLIGVDSVPSWQNYNLFQSIGILFHYQPFTVTGLRAHYDFTDMVGLTLGLNSGWNTIAASYPLQTLEGKLTIKPASWLTYSIEGMYGPTGGNLPSKSGLIEQILTVRPLARLSVTAESYLGDQDANSLASKPIIAAPGNPINPLLFDFPSGIIPQSTEWWGAGSWISYQLARRLQLGFRGEVLDDHDGFLTGLPQRLWEVTAGFNYDITESLVGRFEFRHDESNRKPFPSDKPYVTFPCPGLGFCTSTATTLSSMNTVMTTLLFKF